MIKGEGVIKGEREGARGRWCRGRGSISHLPWSVCGEVVD